MNSWLELLAAAREFHDDKATHSKDASCRLCRVLAVLEEPTLFGDDPPAISRAPLGEHDANALGGFRAGDHETSRKAAIYNYPRSGNQRHRILMALAAAGEHGLITDEMLELTRIPYVSASARVTELCDGGWIEDSKRTRQTRLGAEAKIWVVTEKALEIIDREGE